MLLDGKADPNITDEVQCCLLHVWIMYYCSLCVQTSGWTAVFIAIQSNNLEIVEMLIKGGARLDIKDNVRCWSEFLSLSLCDILSSFILDIIIHFQNGLTAFEVAKANDQQAVCDLLEKYGSKTTEKEITQVGTLLLPIINFNSDHA